MKPKLILKELSRYDVDTYADIIQRNSLLYSDVEAFKCGSKTLTFSEYNDEVNKLIHSLYTLGVKKGDVLGLLSWNCLESAVIYGAAMKGGFIASPFNPRLKSNELEYIINYSETNTLFIGSELVQTVNQLRPKLKKVKNYISIDGPAQEMINFEDLIKSSFDKNPDVHIKEDDPLFLFYTSGTTGVPRGALYSHGSAIDDTKRFVISLGIQPGDRQIQVMPLFHVGGAKAFWGYFFVGGSNVIMPQASFHPESVLQTIQNEKATDIHVVPTHLAALSAVPDVDRYDLSCMKRMLYAASPMPLDLLKEGIKKWGSVFLQNYGGTENGPNVTTLSTQQHNFVGNSVEQKEILSSAGFPQIGVHVRIVDSEDNDLPPNEIGEIIVQSKATIKEFWRKPDESREKIVNGWVHTGDMGRYDERGYIYIVDRKKDMIITGGENVFPREIEAVLCQHPGVKEAAVIGIPDPYWVEKVHAVIVPNNGQNFTSEELIGFCKKQLANFKVPKSIEFVDDLPRNAAGKILKRELVSRLDKVNESGK